MLFHSFPTISFYCFFNARLVHFNQALFSLVFLSFFFSNIGSLHFNKKVSDAATLPRNDTNSVFPFQFESPTFISFFNYFLGFFWSYNYNGTYDSYTLKSYLNENVTSSSSRDRIDAPETLSILTWLSICGQCNSWSQLIHRSWPLHFFFIWYA